MVSNGHADIFPKTHKALFREAPKKYSRPATSSDFARTATAIGNSARFHKSRVPWSPDPTSGAVVALAGGYDFAISKFNRATQAQRQPFRFLSPYLLGGLGPGYTPASVVNDAPVVFPTSQEGGFWRPQELLGSIYGPTRLRVALCQSRNLVSIRLLQSIDLRKRSIWRGASVSTRRTAAIPSASPGRQHRDASSNGTFAGFR